MDNKFCINDIVSISPDSDKIIFFNDFNSPRML